MKTSQKLIYNIKWNEKKKNSNERQKKKQQKYLNGKTNNLIQIIRASKNICLSYSSNTINISNMKIECRRCWKEMVSAFRHLFHQKHEIKNNEPPNRFYSPFLVGLINVHCMRHTYIVIRYDSFLLDTIQFNIWKLTLGLSVMGFYFFFFLLSSTSFHYAPTHTHGSQEQKQIFNWMMRVGLQRKKVKSFDDIILLFFFELWKLTPSTQMMDS